MKSSTIEKLLTITSAEHHEELHRVVGEALEQQVVEVAKYLAHSDRVVYAGKRSAFRDGAERYWDVLYPPQKQRWLNLARALLTGDFTGEDEGSCTARANKPIMPGMRASIRESQR